DAAPASSVARNVRRSIIRIALDTSVCGTTGGATARPPTSPDLALDVAERGLEHSPMRWPARALQVGHHLRSGELQRRDTPGSIRFVLGQWCLVAMITRGRHRLLFLHRLAFPTPCHTCSF